MIFLFALIVMHSPVLLKMRHISFSMFSVFDVLGLVFQMASLSYQSRPMSFVICCI